MPEQDSKNSFSPLFPLLVFIICLALGYLFISPTIQEIKKLNTDIGAKSEEIVLMEKKIGDLKFLKTKFEESQSEVNFLSVALPPDSSMENFIIQISDMVNSSSLNLESITPQKKKAENQILVDLTVSGYYENVVLFINNMEKNNRLLSVKNVNIDSEKSSTDQADGFVTAKLQVGALEVTNKETASSSKEPTEPESQ